MEKAARGPVQLSDELALSFLAQGKVGSGVVGVTTLRLPVFLSEHVR